MECENKQSVAPKVGWLKHPVLTRGAKFDLTIEARPGPAESQSPGRRGGGLSKGRGLGSLRRGSVFQQPLVWTKLW